MAKDRSEVLSFLLRLWRVSDEDRPVWRASLHDPQSGQRTGFASLDELIS